MVPPFTTARGVHYLKSYSRIVPDTQSAGWLTTKTALSVSETDSTGVGTAWGRIGTWYQKPIWMIIVTKKEAKICNHSKNHGISSQLGTSFACWCRFFFYSIEVTCFNKLCRQGFFHMSTGVGNCVPLQGGPLPVLGGVTSSISRLTTPVTHLQGHLEESTKIYICNW